MSRYLLLIFGDRRAWDDAGPEELRRIVAGHRAFAATLGEANLAGWELAPADAAVSVRSRGGARPAVASGTFVDAADVVGGAHVIDAADLDAATRLAELLPEASAPYTAGIEIRELVEPATA